MSKPSPFSRRAVLFAALATPALSLPARAAPRPYTIASGSAQIEFLFDLNGFTQRGTAPLSRADLRIDPDKLTASTADVRADISRAQTGLIFATQAMKSESVLHTDTFREARFRSTRVILGRDGRISDGAALEGQLTLRGVTKPIRLEASLFRPKGSAAGDLSVLDIRLRGAISRAAFGAVGYPKLVTDRVGLDIRARIEAG